MLERNEFLVLRFSLVEEPQTAIITSSIPVPKGAAILPAIERDREFTLNGVQYSFVGFSEAQPSDNSRIEQKRFFIGKLAKLKKAHMGIKIPGDILETEEDDWLPIIVIFDLKEQYILIKKDWRFGTPEQSMNAIQAGLRDPVLAKYNHRVFVKGVTRGETFWKIISDHKKIYKLELKLISPNILETNLIARDALAALKQIFAQDQVDITLNNESGNLKVPQEPVASYLEYIEEGEGTWAITTEGNHGGKKKFTSSQNIESVDISINEEFSDENQKKLDLQHHNESEASTQSNKNIIDKVLIEIGKYRDR